MIKQLEQETFDTLKALADIQSNVSFGRAELKKLKETTEEYMVVREKEVEERVVKVLKKSREALEETTKNHDELSAYGRDLKAYANELNVLANDITALFQDFNKRMEIAEIDGKALLEKVNNTLKITKMERVHIKEDRKLLEIERQITNEAAVKLRDKEGLLRRGFEELKNKQK